MNTHTHVDVVALVFVGLLLGPAESNVTLQVTDFHHVWIKRNMCYGMGNGCCWWPGPFVVWHFARCGDVAYARHVFFFVFCLFRWSQMKDSRNWQIRCALSHIVVAFYLWNECNRTPKSLNSRLFLDNIQLFEPVSRLRYGGVWCTRHSYVLYIFFFLRNYYFLDPNSERLSLLKNESSARWKTLKAYPRATQ